MLHGHLGAIVWMSPDLRLYGTFSVWKNPLYDCQVILPYSHTVMEHLLKCLHHPVIFCYHQKTWGVFIKSVYDSWTLHSSDTSQILDVIEKSIDEGAWFTIYSGSWVHIDACVFVEYKHIFVFVENINRNIFRSQIEFLDLDIHFYLISRSNLEIFCDNTPIDLQKTLIDEFLNITTRKRSKNFAQVEIHSLFGLKKNTKMKFHTYEMMEYWKNLSIWEIFWLESKLFFEVFDFLLILSWNRLFLLFKNIDFSKVNPFVLLFFE